MLLPMLAQAQELPVRAIIGPHCLLPGLSLLPRAQDPDWGPSMALLACSQASRCWPTSLPASLGS